MVQPTKCASGGATIKAELASGEIVELVKDCECLDKFHTGPHWLYLDEYWQSENQRIYDAIDQAEPYTKIALWHDFCIHEAKRLENIKNEMAQRRIIRLIRSEVA